MVSLTKFYAGVPLPVMYSRYLYLVSFLLSALVPISLGLVCVSLIVGGESRWNKETMHKRFEHFRSRFKKAEMRH